MMMPSFLHHYATSHEDFSNGWWRDHGHAFAGLVRTDEYCCANMISNDLEMDEPLPKSTKHLADLQKISL